MSDMLFPRTEVAGVSLSRIFSGAVKTDITLPLQSVVTLVLSE